MAFVKKVGNKFQVRQGNQGELLSTFSTREAALKERARLEKKNKPQEVNKGASARKKFVKPKKAKK